MAIHTSLFIKPAGNYAEEHRLWVCCWYLELRLYNCGDGYWDREYHSFLQQTRFTKYCHEYNWLLQGLTLIQENNERHFVSGEGESKLFYIIIVLSWYSCLRCIVIHGNSGELNGEHALHACHAPSHTSYACTHLYKEREGMLKGTINSNELMGSIKLDKGLLGGMFSGSK